VFLSFPERQNRQVAKIHSKKKPLVASCCPFLQSNLKVDWWNSIKVLITWMKEKQQANVL
jgi:hypothetical protein